MKNFKIKHYKNYELDGYEWEISYNKERENNRQKTSIWIKLLTGAIIGFVNGFWGGGGGMICVPLLTQIIKLPEKKSHATTLLIMLPLSIVSLVVYILRGNMPWFDALKIGTGFVLGGIVGAFLLKIISNGWLGIVFSIIIIAGGLKMIL
ncbi:MAG: TSUP family transporter [Christensenellales bacterium]